MTSSWVSESDGKQSWNVHQNAYCTRHSGVAWIARCINNIIQIAWCSWIRICTKNPSIHRSDVQYVKLCRVMFVSEGWKKGELVSKGRLLTYLVWLVVFNYFVQQLNKNWVITQPWCNGTTTTNHGKPRLYYWNCIDHATWSRKHAIFMYVLLSEHSEQL